MTAGTLRASFIEGSRGRLFVTMHRPAASSGAAVLVVPPFAEEMNKTRRMVAEVGQGLRERGVATVILDLFGTGDSDGEFHEATCSDWLRDISAAAAWSAGEGWPVAGLLAARLGCVLAARAARDGLHGIQHTVFWQPVLSGSRYLTQFLRLRVAASMMDSARGESVSGLRQQLRNGLLEVAGYELSGRMADEIEQLELAESLGPRLGTLHWWEVVRDLTTGLSAASEKCIERVRRSMSVSAGTLAGEPFWTATEIVINAELVASTVAALGAVHAGGNASNEAQSAG